MPICQLCIVEMRKTMAVLRGEIEIIVAPVDMQRIVPGEPVAETVEAQ